ncbi:CDP-glycerol glycerophosphotransferase family protein [Bacillus mycoides]|uniref:CDP-glycerol glycerophosphotransferase family protein n=1 Tax=Bacillus mycoides TaxID=1405 RepID=UPI000B4BC377|nr:CDP-glycerol glycerophosphotransferase family protein [Bacillus mycoides]
MKVSIVVTLQNDSLALLDTAITMLEKQTIGYGNLEVVLVSKDKVEKDFCEYVKTLKQKFKIDILLQENTFNIKALRGEYITFFDLHHKFKPNVYQKMYDVANKDGLDFVSACLSSKHQQIQVNDNVLNSSFEAVTSLKLIKKHILQQAEFSFLTNLTPGIIQYMDFQLYMKPLRYKFIKEIEHKNKADLDEVNILNHIQDLKVMTKYLFDEYREDLNSNIKVLLINHILYISDKAVFLNQIEARYRIQLLEILRELICLSDENTLNSIKGYESYLNLVRNGLYDEAVQYMKLLRSRRYWHKETKKFEVFFEKNPNNLEESLSWKVTKPLRKSYEIFKSVKNMLSTYIIILLSFGVKILKGKKQIWLIGERAEQAEDNGYFFFKYCRENYPNQKIYYIIDENSPHLSKIQQYGNIIYHSSLKHKVYMLAADTYISAWVFEECLYPGEKETFKAQFAKYIANKKNICLQHGVIIQNISPYLRKDKYNQDLIIASSEDEKKIITKTLGYNTKEVAVTGLARFDNLHDKKVKKQILVMPTWRRHLSNLNKADFLQSDYYMTFKSFITNQQLLSVVEKHNIPVKFYIHSQMQKYLSSFVTDHPNIEFLTKSDAVVSELLKESSILITDYSSVSLDFLYMEKPVILYQFDPHNNHHVPSEEIQYKDIGEVISDESEVIKILEQKIENGFKLDKKYCKSSKRIFKYRDERNCERIYQVIKERVS